MTSSSAVNSLRKTLAEEGAAEAMILAVRDHLNGQCPDQLKAPLGATILADAACRMVAQAVIEHGGNAEEMAEIFVSDLRVQMAVTLQSQMKSQGTRK